MIFNRRDPYVMLAKKTLELYVTQRKTPDIESLSLPKEMLEQSAGVFVSIKTKGDRLRGCIGTINPYYENIAEEIVHNAISAGTRDPRFPPVREHELADLVYSVDVLMEAIRIDSIDQLDVKRYGVIVRSGDRTGLLLPNLDGVNTPEEQVSIALSKAGIDPRKEYTLERFEVIRHGEL